MRVAHKANKNGVNHLRSMLLKSPQLEHETNVERQNEKKNLIKKYYKVLFGYKFCLY